ncbi:MAG: helix-turn-helix transcriptional regulator [Eubacteriales bacterium]|jgi:poly-beta-hydroxybutyrate-responsive repressor|nr:helix-turn-helix transcriptional regulator [Bacillota bacterium]MBV1728074.1 helix-turn-helix transcriptional regulator [Desulforudis sp.]MDP3049894.1 helix-turn-helix transcriptional regulator [Eubacteriales bacterium]MDQ7788652.1 helix-turn-helix transcriptional regulator [Clostridia bacterium]MBU4532512.1 helix-turn-helix transcriptional regulator [Bacillota bacterium]
MSERNDVRETELRNLMAGYIDKMVWPTLLLLLVAKPAHGYELIRALHEMDTIEGDLDPATVYRNLRRMEEDDLVSSYWESGAAGPARRLYQLTERGELALHLCVPLVDSRKDSLERFLHNYSAVSTDIGKEKPPNE